MATAEVMFPPGNKVLPGSRPLPTAPFPKPALAPKANISPGEIVDQWILRINRFLHGQEKSPTSLFLEQSHWRDLLCMTWDFRTIQGREKTQEFVRSSYEHSIITTIILDDSNDHKRPQFATFDDLQFVQAFLKIESSRGRGKGLVRLVSDTNDRGQWKAFTLFTALYELRGHEEHVGKRRPTGIDRNFEDGGSNWKDRLVAQQNFAGDREPSVLILGKPYQSNPSQIGES